MASRHALQQLRGRVRDPVRAIRAIQGEGREWCELCGDEIVGHTARHHVYQCSHCRRAYHRNCVDQLRRQEADRGDPLPFGCPGCGTLWREISYFRGRNESSAASSRYRFRRDGEMYLCDGVLPDGRACAFTAPTNNMFYTHYRRMHDNPQFQSGDSSYYACSYCDDALPTWSGLSQHMRRVHNITAAPSQEHRETASAPQQAAARDSHSPQYSAGFFEPPAGVSTTDYYCPCCAMGPVGRMRLLDHVETYHNQELPYCQLCNRDYYAWPELIRHLREDH
ncbi:hypothetical protein BO82DRAFT_414533 [Aspergillus uvarum CBS 121591]|uniref:C2H2-type domain-containing protein n=1 Tax=Aspergillus uvarum CBS 121591 TaxID=1448315 RepID=A0A319CEH4_9EURO|nr:hypothetical protein BO82DRAFT_414533 [Aspergillus uvarum CBS 121591]PYH81757.1 hypothetical protein BO82DRAFT_414533 [Aspergillus uvarum CBS 121591]